MAIDDIAGFRLALRPGIASDPHKEHSVILTAQRKPFYNREKHNPSPIAKDFR
jgi:hypothetical protein